MNCGKRRVGHGGNCALSEIIVVQAKDSGIRAKPQFVSAMAPGEVVVDEEARGSPALNPGVVEPSNRSERRICAAALQHDRECRERLLKVARPKQTLVPGKCRIEVVHQILRKDVRVSRRKRVERLRRKSVEQGVDGIGVSGLQSVVGLKTKPRGIFLIDVVVDAGGLYLFMVVAGVRNALPVRATISIGWTARCRAAVCIEGTAEHGERRAAGVSVERKHLLIERNQLRRGADRLIRLRSPFRPEEVAARRIVGTPRWERSSA